MCIRDSGYTLNEELLTRLNTAANVITTGTSTLGADSTEVQAAQTALDDFSACLDAVQADGSKQDLTSLPYYQGSTMHALYQANEALGAVSYTHLHGSCRCQSRAAPRARAALTAAATVRQSARTRMPCT